MEEILWITAVKGRGTGPVTMPMNPTAMDPFTTVPMGPAMDPTPDTTMDPGPMDSIVDSMVDLDLLTTLGADPMVSIIRYESILCLLEVRLMWEKAGFSSYHQMCKYIEKMM
jgi:hypothetical protein